MAYNKNTNWDNEKKYLDNLSKNGNAGQKAWAENQKKELASAQAKYSSNTSTNTGGGSKGGTVGGSSGGGNKNSQYTNSQYTAPTLGNTWDAKTDYQSIINNAVKNGDYVTAAKAEQLRNQKIRGTGSSYGTTNSYLSYFPDLGTYGQQQMANGASWQDVLDIYYARNDKASTTEGLEKYHNDAIQQNMWDYIVNLLKQENQQNALNDSEQYMNDWEDDNPKEDYDGKYDKRIDKLLNEILNRDDFSYDAMNDPLYQQYAAMYQREGDRAMKETLAEAAAGAGGMNTYAITAAQQANSYYNSQLNDKIPQLYQLAYDMYLNDKESMVQDLGILQDMDATQYNRYRDTINDWYNDKNFAYNAYQNAVNQGNWQTNFDYNSMLDNRNWNNDNYWANKEWNYNDFWKNKEYTDNRADIDYERNQAEEEEAKNTIAWYIENGVSADAIPKDLITKSGLDETAIAQMVTYFQTQQATKGKSSGGGGGNGKDPDDDNYKKEDLVYEKQVGNSPHSEYGKIAEACARYAAEGDKWKAAATAKNALDNKVITQEEYNELLAKYNPMLDSILDYDPNKVFGLK
jgi:hypothetical protein